jgi:UDP-glucose 4-epimerase
MQTLITGGAGFIGSHLAERLIAQGRSVIVLDNLSTGSTENLTKLRQHPLFTFVEGSVLDEFVVGELMSGCDTVVHLAAAVGVRYILAHPLEAIRTNVDGTDIVLRLAAPRRQRVLLASTSEIYGKNSSGPLCETADSILGPSQIERWSYATAKKLDEFLAFAYAQTYGLPVTVTRFFNIVGPRQRARYGMVLPNFIRAALAGEPIRVFGDGQQTRNFCFVQDCVDAMIGLLSNTAAVGRVFNIGGPEEISMLKLADRVKRITASDSRIETVPYAEAYPEGNFEDMRRRVPCICGIHSLTGWTPTTSLDSIIAQTKVYEEHRATQMQPSPVALNEAAACHPFVM